MLAKKRANTATNKNGSITSKKVQAASPNKLPKIYKSQPKRSVECQTYVCNADIIQFIKDRSETSETPLNYFLCNLKYENNMYCAEVQVNLNPKFVNIANKKDTNSIVIKSDDYIKGNYEKKSAVCHNDPKDYSFCGIKSIKTDSDLMDLTGVNFETFYLLYSFIPSFTKSKWDSENKLLMVFMKLKTGLTFSALGVLLGVHRTTARRTFVQIVECLSNAINNSKDDIKGSLPDTFKFNLDLAVRSLNEQNLK